LYKSFTIHSFLSWIFTFFSLFFCLILQFFLFLILLYNSFFIWIFFTILFFRFFLKIFLSLSYSFYNSFFTIPRAFSFFYNCPDFPLYLQLSEFPVNACDWLRQSFRPGLPDDTKPGKNVPNEHKMYQMVIKHPKCLQNDHNDHKVY
jgi:hypothetical protein